MFSFSRAQLLLGTVVIVFFGLSPTAPSRASAEVRATTVPGDACGAKVAKPLLGYWKCTFVDNFSGTTLNKAKWNYQDTSVTGFVLGRSCFRPGVNTRLAKGALRLSVTRKAEPFTCKSPYGNIQTRYLGADISTYGKFEQPYGRFQARLRYPTPYPAGYHGGFWLNPQDHAYGSWPLSGELDIAEWWSSTPTHVYPSLHYLGSSINDSGMNCIIGDPSKFHTYTMEWSLIDIKFFYDGKRCFTRALTPILLLGGPMPFDQRFYISLTFGEGGPVGPSTSKTPFPATMVVDYVKVWS